MLAKFSGVESDRTVFKVVLCSQPTLEIRKFHFVVVQRRPRNVQKSASHVQSCYFACINILLFSPVVVAVTVIVVLATMVT